MKFLVIKKISYIFILVAVMMIAYALNFIDVAITYINKINFVFDTFSYDLIKAIGNNNNYTEIFSAGAAFSGTVLAIFFTLVSLPLQNILSRYSQDLITRVRRDPIFISSFIFLGVTFTYNLTLLTFGTSPYLVIVSFGLGITSVLMLFLLVLHTFFLLDVRNQITEITSKIKRNIRRKIIISENEKNKEYSKIEELMKNHEK